MENLDIFYNYRGQRQRQRQRQRINHARQIIPTAIPHSEQHYFDQINIFEFLCIYLFRMGSKKIKIRAFTKKARKFYAPNIQYEHVRNMTRAYEIICKEFQLRPDFRTETRLFKQNGRDYTRSIDEKSRECQTLLTLGETREHKQYIRDETQSMVRQTAETGRKMLACISDIYARGYTAASIDHPEFAGQIGQKNQNIRAHKKENFELAFPKRKFGYHSKTQPPDLLGYYNENGTDNFYPILFETLLRLVVKRKLEDKKRLFGKEKRWYTVKVGRLHRWAHDFQFGKTGEALIDIFNANVGALGLRGFFRTRPPISSDIIRTNYTTLKNQLTATQPTYLEAYNLLDQATQEFEQSQVTYTNKDRQIGELTIRIETLESDIEDNLSDISDKINQAFIAKISSRQKPKKKSTENDNRSRSISTSSTSTPILSITEKFGIELTGVMDKDRGPIFNAICTYKSRDVNDAGAAIGDFIELRHLLYKTYLKENRGIRRSTWVTYNHTNGEFTRCRESWAEIETLIGVKIMYIILKNFGTRQTLSAQKNYEEVYRDLTTDNCFFIVAYRQSRIKIYDRERATPKKPYVSMSSTATNFLKGLLKQDYKSATNALSKKWTTIAVKKYHYTDIFR
ncbi:MAG: hypothetical protein GY710_08625 [Desulfobacteraceae bacterium]|nr:hypothetical protein [Desulfobacteraceae bacterium]